MGFLETMKKHSILMEGALGERLKREYHLTFDDQVVMASLIYEPKGARALTSIWNEYIDVARKYHLPFLATTPTRRVNKERVELSRWEQSIIKDNTDFLMSIRRNSGIEMYAGGMMGAKGDAYTGIGALSSKQEAKEFHLWEADLFCKAQADFLFAGLMPTIEEAVGMALAMSETRLPYIISFTIQRDGKLIDGTTIFDAISRIDAETDHRPVGYMANCVHPNITYEALQQPFNRNSVVKERFIGLQANTSKLSYAELDNSKDLKASDPKELAEDMIRLRELIPMKIFGGCCGTDARHMDQIASKIC